MSSFFFRMLWINPRGNAMRKMFNWLAVWLERMFPEYTEDLPRVDNRHAPPALAKRRPMVTR